MKDMIDLTYDIEESMSVFNAYWHPKIQITQMGKHDSEGRETRKLILGTHSGTHIDAPSHFVKEGTTIDQIQLSRLIGPITIVDFSELKDNQMVNLEMIKKVQLSDNILFKFGWGKHWKKDYFFQKCPFLSKEAAEYLVSKKVKLIATDTPSLDDPRTKLQGNMLGSVDDSPIHKILLGNGIVLVEYIANLDQLSDLQGWNILALPIKVKGGDGAPARVCLYR
ncbi:cyclase family protein [Candidatus Woesearchaeota archaeon]|nr:hypothetical protein [uncultured archaeon]MBS3124367.1 cyclase family protein [Candidatus Woesearchaeota archaeon]